MTTTTDLRERIAKIVGDAGYDAGASVFDTRSVADRIIALISEPELVADDIERAARAIWRERWTEQLGPAVYDWEQNKKGYIRDARAALKQSLNKQEE